MNDLGGSRGSQLRDPHTFRPAAIRYDRTRLLTRRALLHPAVLKQLFRLLFALLRKLQQGLDCLRVGDTASQPITPLCRVEQLVSRLA
jgi:hypothetical protein